MTRSSATDFSARVTKDSLVFSAAHFITYNETICERLHGHNWRVDVRLEGSLDANGYVFDFIALRDAAMEIVGRLDHRVLLPAHHPRISVEELKDSAEVEARFERRRWVFPTEDCVILPVENTTAELIARWITGELKSGLNLSDTPTVASIRVGVEENFGQWAEYSEVLRSSH